MGTSGDDKLIGIHVTVGPDERLEDVVASLKANGAEVQHLFAGRGVATGVAPKHSLPALRAVKGVDRLAVASLDETDFQLPPLSGRIPQ